MLFSVEPLVAVSLLPRGLTLMSLVFPRICCTMEAYLPLHALLYSLTTKAYHQRLIINSHPENVSSQRVYPYGVFMIEAKSKTVPSPSPLFSLCWHLLRVCYITVVRYTLFDVIQGEKLGVYLNIRFFYTLPWLLMYGDDLWT